MKLYYWVTGNNSIVHLESHNEYNSLVHHESHNECNNEIPTLHYFNIRGKGEAIRIAFEDKNIKFNDDSFSFSEWGFKSTDNGLKSKWISEGKLLFGQVPLLEIDGINIVQTHSILRYLASKYNWYQNLNASTIALIDMASEGTEDIRKQLSAIEYDEDLKESEKQIKFETFFKKDGIKWYGYFNKMALKNGHNKFIAGTDEPTHADYLLFDLIDTAERLCSTHASPLIESLTGLKEFKTRIITRPAISSYLKSDRRRKE